MARMNKQQKPDATQPPAWHTLDSSEVFARLQTRPEGLQQADAGERLTRHGPNRLPPAGRRGALVRLATQFHNVLIYVLLGAGVVTTLLGHYVDAGVIFGVVLINALIGFVQEGKAEKALDAVRNLLSQQAVVLRAGERRTIPAEDVVPGDVLYLQSGDRVAADLRLFRARDLRVDEALLTGESVPAEKHHRPVDANATLGDRRNMAFSGTLVTFGQGFGVAVGTGEQTEIGRISHMLSEVQTLTTPLLRQLAVFGRWLTGAILVIASATFLFGTFIRDYAADEMFLAAVGLAVAAIPEGLPAIITITLAIGVQRMAHRNAIIRRLPAVETLGSVTVICSDKTGTLTRNEMTVQDVVTDAHGFRVSGVGYNPHGGFADGGRDVLPAEQPELLEVCHAAMLCNDARLNRNGDGCRLDGDPTEGALVTLALKAGLDGDCLLAEYPRIDEIPFESEHRFMATLHHDHAGHGFVYIKGAPEVIFPRCSHQRRGGDVVPLDTERWHRDAEQLAAGGQRILAVAFKPASVEQPALNFADVDGGLILLGLVGIIDPPRDEAIDAVHQCREAGIGVKMITGDHAATAAAIAARMGIVDAIEAVTGNDIEQLDDSALRTRAAGASVFARTSPEHKLRLVTALQANGEVVAMTGDGVNDAPALKRADVGVAMGIKGTEAAKEAAEMVLADDNFASIAHAVEEGRTVYDNIKKAILFILPTNGGEALTILAAIALGRSLPVTPAQILWVNMITAVTLALALAFEPAEANVMRRAPRDPRQPLLTAFMNWRILFVSLLMVAGTFGLFVWERSLGAELEAARTVAVNTLVFAEACYLFATRFLTAPVLNRNGLLGSRYVLGAVVLVMLMQMVFTYAPFMQTFFRTAAIGVDEWARIVAVGVAVLVLVEIEKTVVRRLQAARNLRIG
jgi:magnesium-transporting ATPase (P-type)